MDSLTHIVLGACIGETVAGKNFGRKAMLAGALAQSVPDIDFVTHFWLQQPDEILAHRGFTHSIVFAILATSVLSFLFVKFFHKEPVAWKRWVFLFGLNTFSHILLDSLNAYGVGWFEPFSHLRFSFHVLYVADPVFSTWVFIGFLCILIFRQNRHRRMAAIVAITMSGLYLAFASFNKIKIDKIVNGELERQSVSSREFFTTPTPFNSMLWFVVVKLQDGYYAGYVSVFDRKKEIQFHYFPRNDSLLSAVKDQEEVNSLLRFSQGYFTVEKWQDTVVFNVLRFGQVAGWHDPAERFAFHYFLDRPGANALVVQRGRFAKWNRQTINSFFRRIGGN